MHTESPVNLSTKTEEAAIYLTNRQRWSQGGAVMDDEWK